MQTHPAAELFPILSGPELQDLADDIKTNGLFVPIVVHDGVLLDGRNRLKACEMAGVQPRFEEYRGKSAVSFIVSANIKRRHLEKSQLAIIGTGLKPHFEEEARKRQEATRAKPGEAADKRAGNISYTQEPKGQSRDQVGAMLGVSGKMISDAEAIKRDAPDLAEKVKAGKITINKAKKEIKSRNDPPEKQRPESDSNNLYQLKMFWMKAAVKDREKFLAWVQSKGGIHGKGREVNIGHPPISRTVA